MLARRLDLRDENAALLLLGMIVLALMVAQLAQPVDAAGAAAGRRAAAKLAPSGRGSGRATSAPPAACWC
ncbi:MAG: hypothetical protein MZW92_66770 [Comamonadaceae bacterium]|nr:hypothetical protein [Comamonadaceae bacterium]